MKRLVSIAAAAMLAAGCATDTIGVKKGEQIAFVASPAERPIPPVQFSNQAVAHDAGVGVVGGSIAAAPLSIACGPFWFLCAGPLMIVGGAAGAVAGAAVGVIEGAPEEVRQQVQHRAEEYIRSHDVRAELLAALNERGRDHWTVVEPSDRVATVRVTVENISIQGSRKGRVAFVMQARISVRGANGGPEEENVFRYVSSEFDADYWLRNPDVVERNFHFAYDWIGGRIVGHLATAHPYVSPYKGHPAGD